MPDQIIYQDDRDDAVEPDDESGWGEPLFADDSTCESGWTGDRCTLPLLHEGDHSND